MSTQNQSPSAIMAFRSLKRTHDMFLSNHGMPVGISEAHESQRIKLAIRARDEYGAVIDGTAPVASDAPAPARVRSTPVDERASTTASAAVNAAGAAPTTLAVHTKRAFGAASPAGASSGGVLAIHQPLSEAQIKQSESRLPPTQKELDELHARLGLEDAVKQSQQQDSESGVGSSSSSSSKKAPAGPDMRVSKITGLSADQQRQLAVRQAPTMVKPTWHPPWKLMRVISGHQGWVHSIAVDPTNEWFVTGSRDRTIKVWDLASGTLRLTLTGHISTVRRLAISDRQPYLFSVGEDKMVRCWDLEQNKTIRHYHGHLSAVYALALHPKQDVLVTGGRDSTVRVWDMRTCLNVHTLTGHTNTVNDIVTQAFDPQIVSASQDSTVRLWDLRMGRSLVTLTNHKKGVRALAMHEKEFTFVSASPDNIKQWKFPNGDFMQNLSGHRAIINTLALNADNVLVSGGNDGSLHFYDYHSGAPFQTLIPPVQPGSLEAEAGVLCSAFDKSGSRLITGESDKSIKIFKEDDTATEESHPVVWHPGMKRSRF